MLGPAWYTNGPLLGELTLQGTRQPASEGFYALRLAPEAAVCPKLFTAACTWVIQHWRDRCLTESAKRVMSVVPGIMKLIRGRQTNRCSWLQSETLLSSKQSDLLL